MDTIPGISKNAAKKRRQREKRAATNSATPATVADTSPPAVITPNASDTTIAATDDSEYPDKATKDLWWSVARRAAKQAWQNKYAIKQRRLMAASAPPLWNDTWSDARQVAENYYIKHLFRTAPIAVYAIVEPTTTANHTTSAPPLTPALILTPMHTDTATSPAKDCDTVEKVDVKLLRMQEYWAESRSEPFPQGIQDTIADLRAALEKQNKETPTISESDAPASPADTATPATYQTTTTPERLDRTSDA
jgi:hypothetical protein